MKVGDQVEILKPGHEAHAGVGVIVRFSSKSALYTVAVLLNRWTPYVFRELDFQLLVPQSANFPTLDDVLDDIEAQGCPIRLESIRRAEAAARQTPC